MEIDWNDKDVVLDTVKNYGLSLRYTSDRLKDDKEVVLTAVKKNGYALKYTSERLKDDKEVVLAAVKKDGYALQYTSKRLLNDKEVVLAAIQRDCWALEFASERLKDDKEVVLTAVKNEGFALRYASKRLQKEGLENAIIEGEQLTKQPIIIVDKEYTILITDGYLRVGCKRHTFKEWLSFAEKDIKSMGKPALEFYRNNRDMLKELCLNRGHPHV